MDISFLVSKQKLKLLSCSCNTGTHRDWFRTHAQLASIFTYAMPDDICNPHPWYFLDIKQFAQILFSVQYLKGGRTMHLLELILKYK